MMGASSMLASGGGCLRSSAWRCKSLKAGRGQMVLSKDVCRAVFSAILLLEFPVLIAALCYFLLTCANIRPGKLWPACVMGPLSLFLPFLYTEAGNRYRARFLL